MITVHLAERLDYLLREQGRPWQPATGDRFVIPGRDLDGTFVVADMVIEVEDLPSGQLLCFNGTTEWALDSFPAKDALWMPWEHQLRALLDDRFASLHRLPHRDVTAYLVTLADGRTFRDEDPEVAYAAALLADAP